MSVDLNRFFPENLSRRQFEVLRLAAEGHGIESSAQALRVQPQTVKYHRHYVLTKLGAKTMPHAVHLAHGKGLLA